VKRDETEASAAPALDVAGVSNSVAPRQLGRRALLRGGLAVCAGAVATALAACTSEGGNAGTTSSAGTESATNPVPRRTTGAWPSIPAELTVIPQEFTGPADRQGTLVELDYETFESMSYQENPQPLSKRAIVYLPYGYTEDKEYDVFYLMHGGWSNETTTLGTPGGPSDFKNVLDHAIAAKQIRALIIVCPTYNNTSSRDSANFSLALTLNENYHHELLNDLIPAVESRFAGYAENVSTEGLMAARDHRGFGGFSMGAVATWRTFQHGLDYFRYFLPMSCGTSLDMDDILPAAQGRDRADYFVCVITGTDDFAHPFEEDRVGLMRTSPYFADADNDQEANFVFRVKDGYTHDEVAANEYTYNGLRWF
jgi:enterochelin esterase-like enzyme